MEKEEVKEKTRATYDKVGSDYDSWYWMKKSKELRAGLTEQVVKILKKELKGKPKVLDLCCGTGHLVDEISKLGGVYRPGLCPEYDIALSREVPQQRVRPSRC